MDPNLAGMQRDLALDGKRQVALLPWKSVDAPKQEYEIVMPLNLFDELRRKVPVGNSTPPLTAEPPRKQIVRNVLSG